ncbi:MAG TPA: serpin family protein [Ktedonobacteraceae bacterium]|jgi:hypothetical protein|nr:serpin family protein [Ktedonobacteraceae bacterium]
MSSTAVIYPIVAALMKAEEFIGPHRVWQSVNRTQAVFLSEFFASCRQESLSIAEIESIASFSSGELNRFLRARGFRIELAPLQSGNDWKEVGIVSVLDLSVNWSSPGLEMKVRGQDGKVYPGVYLIFAESRFYRAAHHDYPIVQLSTTSSDRVYMTRLDSALADFELLHKVQQLSDSCQPIDDYGEVIFPMVDLKQEVDISWLVNLETTSAEGEPVKISHALQETHLALDEEGARAKSATAVIHKIGGVGVPKPLLVIDGPFLIWIERPGLMKPLFVGYITEENWKKPEKQKEQPYID